MKIGNTSALDSSYIIDGVKMRFTPREILESANENGQKILDETTEPIVDESIDPSPVTGEFSNNIIHRHIDHLYALMRIPRNIPANCADNISKAETGKAIINMLWRNGHFRLDDLQVHTTWKWDTAPVGNMAAFYSSVESVCNYLDLLGIQLAGYEFVENTGKCEILLETDLAGSAQTEVEANEDEPAEDATEMKLFLCAEPFKTLDPELSNGRKCPENIIGDTDNWLIYIPFDTCKYRLGGSLLEELSGIPGGKSPDIQDTDYFMDCFEVVREFVEDGIVLSGVTVGTGGLMTALKRMAGDKGIDADIESIIQSYKENDAIKILFSEIPGVIIEIPSSDFDYVDAELLLQDVAYYPVGHPGTNGLTVNNKSKDSLSGILQSLLDMQAAEGED